MKFRPRPRRKRWALLVPGIYFVLLLSPLVVLFIPSERGLIEYGYFQRVFEDNTLLLSTGERVRLIGVDTPKGKHPRRPIDDFGKEATAFIRSMVEGKRIRLEYENITPVVGHKDSSGLTLAYVFLEDGTHVNAELIRHGCGPAFTNIPYGRLNEFRELEQDARQQRRGLWRTKQQEK